MRFAWALQRYALYADTTRQLQPIVRCLQVQDELSFSDITPFQCRIRDMTYSAPIFVDVEYTVGQVG